MLRDWLMHPVSVNEAEQSHMISDSRLGDSPVPFGFKNNEWRRIHDEMDPSDQLFVFEVPPDVRHEHAGCSGIAHVRNGEVIGYIVTRQICL